jgi:hypothetical protein
MTIDNETRREIEFAIARQVILDLLAEGYSISLHDGEDIVVSSSTVCTDILNAMFSVDEETLIVYSPEGDWRIVQFVYGNDGYDVVCDYDVSLEKTLKNSRKLADKLEKQYT